MYQSGSLMLQHRHPSSWCSPFQLRYAWHQSKLCLLNFGSVLMVFGSAACLNQKVSMFFLVKPTFPRSLGEYTLWPYMGIQVVVWVLKVEPLVRRKKKTSSNLFHTALKFLFTTREKTSTHSSSLSSPLRGGPSLALCWRVRHWWVRSPLAATQLSVTVSLRFRRLKTKKLI